MFERISLEGYGIEFWALHHKSKEWAGENLTDVTQMSFGNNYLSPRGQSPPASALLVMGR